MPARADASASASDTLRGSPRTRRTTQYAQTPAQPSCTLSTSRVRVPGVARGASAGAGAPGAPAGCGEAPACCRAAPHASSGVASAMTPWVASRVASPTTSWVASPTAPVPPATSFVPAARSAAPLFANRPASAAQSGRAATVTPSPSNCSGRSTAAQPATTTCLPPAAARRTRRRDLRSASAVTQHVCTTTTSAAPQAVTGSRPAATRLARASSPSAWLILQPTKLAATLVTRAS